MSEFNYILDRINNADFQSDPFKFIYLENFLSDEHFEIITTDPQINIDEVGSTEELMETLLGRSYKPVPFPGCTTSITDYIQWYNHRNVESPGHTHNLIEGFGISFRLQKYDNPKIQDLVNFLNSKEFYECIMNKFDKSIKSDTYVETAIQKYVSGYEISPHPDIRKKVLTYMLNINPGKESEILRLHTNFMKFKPEKEHIYELWEDPNVERFWVPWDWCYTVFKQIKNNSITIFAPDNNTLHAVKLEYDHCKTQRTQVYGNVWYYKSNTKIKPTWKDLK